MRIGSLCTGYGGIELGLALAGVAVDVRWIAEFEPAVAGLHSAPNLGDITQVDWSAVERVDMITAGFPCQPTSSAGRQLGDADPRWLWPSVYRAIRNLGPRQVMIENVRNLVSYDKGRLWEGILADLTFAGYDVRWLTLGACQVGAAHHRHRVFALAAFAGQTGTAERLKMTACGAKGSVLPTPTARDGDGRGEGDTAYWREHRRPSGIPLGAELALLPTPQARDGQGRGAPNEDTAAARFDAGRRNLDDGIALWGRFAAAIERHAAAFGPPPEPTEPNRNGAPRLAPAFAEWLMCLPAGYVTATLPRNAALKAIGNGVCPPQLALAYRYLTTELEDNYSRTHDDIDPRQESDDMQPGYPANYGQPAPVANPNYAYAPANGQPPQAPPAMQLGNPDGTTSLGLHDPNLGAGPGPSPDELLGCCVLFIPKSVDENAAIPERFMQRDPATGQIVGPTTKPEITADVVVISSPAGGNYYFGAAPKASPPRRQPTHAVALPAIFARRKFNQGNIVTALRGFIGTGAVVGIVFESDKGTKGSPPKSIQTLDDNDPRRAVAMQLLQQYSANGGKLTLNEPTEMNAAPQMPANIYAQPAAPQPQYVPTAPASVQYAPAPAPQFVAPAPAQPAQDPAYAAWLASQQAAPAPQAEYIPAGFEAMWPTMDAQMRQAVLAQDAARQAGQPHPLA